MLTRTGASSAAWSGRCPTRAVGRADVASLGLPGEPTAYLCGPLPFMRAGHADLLARDLPTAAIHYEVFGPDLWLAEDCPPRGDAAIGVVTAADRGKGAPGSLSGYVDC